MSAIEVNGLSVRVGTTSLVSEVDLRIEAGTWTTIIGPNGAGKTTLVETVAGVRTASEGSVTILGRDTHDLRERERARLVAFVPQHPVVPFGMSVRDYVSLGRTAHHGFLGAPSPQSRALVDGVLDRLKLGDLARRDVSTLSGGERQRSVLARALAQSTTVILLDEPTTGLDLRHQLETLELLRREVDECALTVLATLHDLTLAGQFADRLALLARGHLVEEGPSAQIVRSTSLSSAYEMALRVIEVDGADVVVPTRSISPSTGSTSGDGGH